MMEALGTVFTAVIGFVGQTVTALVSSSGELKDLLPLFCLGVGVSLFGICFKNIRRICWGA